MTELPPPPNLMVPPRATPKNPSAVQPGQTWTRDGDSRRPSDLIVLHTNRGRNRPGFAICLGSQSGLVTRIQLPRFTTHHHMHQLTPLGPIAALARIEAEKHIDSPRVQRRIKEGINS